MKRRAAALALGLAALGRALWAEGSPPVAVRALTGASLETAALLLSPQEGGTLPLAAVAFGQPASPRIAIELEVRGASLIDGRDEDPVRLMVAAYAIAGDGAVAADVV